MKKKIFFLFVLLFSFKAQSQSLITIGPKIAYNFNRFYDYDTDAGIDYDYLKNWSYGFFLRLDMGELYLQPELNFNTKGSIFKLLRNPLDSGINSLSGSVRLNSIELPVLTVYEITTKGDILLNFRIFGGVVATFIINEEINDLKLFNNQNYRFNKYNIGVQAGVGLDIGILALDFRYAGGISNINSYFKQKNYSFELALGFKML